METVAQVQLTEINPVVGDVAEKSVDGWQATPRVLSVSTSRLSP